MDVIEWSELDILPCLIGEYVAPAVQELFSLVQRVPP